MSLNPFDAIEKVINEHGSAEIRKERLEFAKEQYGALERNAKELFEKVAKLEVKLEMEQAAHLETKRELQKLKDEHAEEIRMFKTIEFRLGKRTGGKWMPFCPSCHLPAYDDPSANDYISCPLCPWVSTVYAGTLSGVVSQFDPA